MPTTRETSLANVRRSAAATGAPLIQEGPRNYCFLMHPANSWRSFDDITLVQSDRPWLPGDFITAAGALATTPASIVGINCLNLNTSAGAQGTNAATRDLEVADAYLQYGTLDVAAVNTQLATRGIIVRQAILANVRGGGFDPNVDGPPISGVPSGTPGASYAPDTLEAAEPEEKADDHGRVSAAEQQEAKERQTTPPPRPSTDTGPPRRPRGENP